MNELTICPPPVDGAADYAIDLRPTVANLVEMWRWHNVIAEVEATHFAGDRAGASARPGRGFEQSAPVRRGEPRRCRTTAHSRRSFSLYRCTRSLVIVVQSAIILR